MPLERFDETDPERGPYMSIYFDMRDGNRIVRVRVLPYVLEDFTNNSITEENFFEIFEKHRTELEQRASRQYDSGEYLMNGSDFLLMVEKSEDQ